MSTLAMPQYLPVELREPEDTPELAALRITVADYDDLMEDCMMKLLSKEEQAELDQIIEFLNLKELEQWEGVPGEIVEMIASHSDDTTDFPMVRLMLGHKPSDY
jgi:hypothetical protein